MTSRVVSDEKQRQRYSTFHWPICNNYLEMKRDEPRLVPCDDVIGADYATVTSLLR